MQLKFDAHILREISTTCVSMQASPSISSGSTKLTVSVRILGNGLGKISFE